MCKKSSILESALREQYYYDLHIVDFNNYTYIHAEPFPSPNGMFLSDIGPTHMTFKWSPLLLNCPSLKYIITSERSNCGICPNTTTNTTATCTDMTIDGQTCNLFVQTEVCESIIGEKSKQLEVKLKGNTCVHCHVVMHVCIHACDQTQYQVANNLKVLL